MSHYNGNFAHMSEIWTYLWYIPKLLKMSFVLDTKQAQLRCLWTRKNRGNALWTEWLSGSVLFNEIACVEPKKRIWILNRFQDYLYSVFLFCRSRLVWFLAWANFYQWNSHIEINVAQFKSGQQIPHLQTLSLNSSIP